MPPSPAERLTIHEAQRDVREIYHGGFIGPLVSAGIWLAAAVAAESAGVSWGAPVLFFGGMLIFPLSMIGNRMLGRRPDLPAGHPMRGLAMQSAFGMVAALLAAWVLASVVPDAFFALAMVIVGAHYFTFTHLYGDVVFLVFGVAQVVTGLLVMVNTGPTTLGAYLMAALLVSMSATLFVRHHRSRTSIPPRTE